jgi:hypothetical protein
MNEVAVKEMFDRYHKKVQTNPNLYTNARDRNSAVLVVLPKELLDYANRGAGHSGFAANARPVGIRRVVSDSASYLKNIFTSVESLKTFIESSECDADEYINEVKLRHAGITPSKKSKVSTTDDRPVNETFFEKYTINDAKALQNKFGREMVLKDFNILTINEFELRYGL